MSSPSATGLAPDGSRARPPFERIALLLQGGGALGSYQAGVYQALAESDLHPDWVAGISIGAINAALIAGNPPERRVEHLRAFWETVTQSPFGIPYLPSVDIKNDMQRQMINQFRAMGTMLWGASNFFKPRIPPPIFMPAGNPGNLAFYDISPLKALLERLVDFDLINAKETRFSVGATNVPREDTLAFQVDLWSARGELPRDMIEVDTRQKDIRFSSRTRAGTDAFRNMQALRRAAAKLLEQMAPELRQTPEAELLAQAADTKVYNIIHLIYHARNYEGASKDYEFSRRTMEEHWKTGYSDMERTLRHPEVLQRPQSPDGVFTFDLKQQGREQEK